MKDILRASAPIKHIVNDQELVSHTVDIEFSELGVISYRKDDGDLTPFGGSGIEVIEGVMPSPSEYVGKIVLYMGEPTIQFAKKHLYLGSEDRFHVTSWIDVTTDIEVTDVKEHNEYLVDDLRGYRLYQYRNAGVPVFDSNHGFYWLTPESGYKEWSKKGDMIVVGIDAGTTNMVYNAFICGDLTGVTEAQLDDYAARAYALSRNHGVISTLHSDPVHFYSGSTDTWHGTTGAPGYKYILYDHNGPQYDFFADTLTNIETVLAGQYFTRTSFTPGRFVTSEEDARLFENMYSGINFINKIAILDYSGEDINSLMRHGDKKSWYEVKTEASEHVSGYYKAEGNLYSGLTKPEKYLFGKFLDESASTPVNMIFYYSSNLTQDVFDEISTEIEAITTVTTQTICGILGEAKEDIVYHGETVPEGTEFTVLSYNGKSFNAFEPQLESLFWGNYYHAKSTATATVDKLINIVAQITSSTSEILTYDPEVLTADSDGLVKLDGVFYNGLAWEEVTDGGGIRQVSTYEDPTTEHELIQWVSDDDTEHGLYRDCAYCAEYNEEDVLEWKLWVVNAESVTDITPEVSLATGVTGHVQRHGNLIVFDLVVDSATDVIQLASDMPKPFPGTTPSFTALAGEGTGYAVTVSISTVGVMSIEDSEGYQNLSVSGSYFSKDFAEAKGYTLPTYEHLRDITSDVNKTAGVQGYVHRLGNQVEFYFNYISSLKIASIALSMPKPATGEPVFAAVTDKEASSLAANVALRSSGMLEFEDTDGYNSFTVHGTYFSSDFDSYMGFDIAMKASVVEVNPDHTMTFGIDSLDNWGYKKDGTSGVVPFYPVKVVVDADMGDIVDNWSYYKDHPEQLQFTKEGALCTYADHLVAEDWYYWKGCAPYGATLDYISTVEYRVVGSTGEVDRIDINKGYVMKAADTLQAGSSHKIKFGVDSSGNFGYLKEGTGSVIPFKTCSAYETISSLSTLDKTTSVMTTEGIKQLASRCVSSGTRYLRTTYTGESNLTISNGGVTLGTWNRGTMNKNTFTCTHDCIMYFGKRSANMTMYFNGSHPYPMVQVAGYGVFSNSNSSHSSWITFIKSGETFVFDFGGQGYVPDSDSSSGVQAAYFLVV